MVLPWSRMRIDDVDVKDFPQEDITLRSVE
jgi:hypothetical protein